LPTVPDIAHQRAVIAPEANADLARRFAHAPAEWRAAVDVRRKQMGLPTLWETRGGVAVAKSSTRPKPLKPKPSPVVSQTRAGIVALCVPGQSSPVACPGDTALLPEVILPGAFNAFLRDVAEGREVVTLEMGHHGTPLASTQDGTLRLRADLVHGLVAEADLFSHPLDRLVQRQIAATAPGMIGVSIMLRDAKWRHEQRNGRTVRVIYEAGLRHVAILLTERSERAAYAKSCVVGIPSMDAAAVKAATNTLVCRASMR